MKQKGTQEMLANLTKVYDLQGKVTYSATPLALEAHFEHFWTQGYERNCLVARRVREKLRNQALKGKKRRKLREKLLEAKGYAVFFTIPQRLSFYKGKLNKRHTSHAKQQSPKNVKIQRNLLLKVPE